MDWCTILEFGILVYLLVQVIRFVFSDCDLQLQWAAKFGRSTGTLARKVVWITGASSGIGEYLAYEMAKAGCRLVLSARREQELERVKKECLSYGTLRDEDVLVLPLDMVRFELHKPAVDEVLERFKQIDILVNNAGRSQRAMFVDTDMEVDRQMFELNVMSILSLTKLVLPHMIERKEGHIVVTSSVAGKMAMPGSASYLGAKHAIQGYFNGLRPESYDKNICVTTVCPGPTFSKFLEAAFTGKPGESFGEKMSATDKRLTTERCAQLMAVAIANKLSEVWIALQPVLLFVYLAQYCPTTYTWLCNKIGMKQANKMREGK